MPAALILVVLLRGVNVGGSRCKMSLLKEIMMSLCTHKVLDAQTYLQSGNVVLNVEPKAESDSGVDIPALENEIGMAVDIRCGFKPYVFAMTAQDFTDVISTNPFLAEAEDEMKSVHLFLFPREYALDVNATASADQMKTSTEKFMFVGGSLFLHTPNRFGVSQLARHIEKIFKSPATARNWRSVMNVAALAARMGEYATGSQGGARAVVSKGGAAESSCSSIPKGKRRRLSSKVD